jgi:hypothetical protein
MPWPDNEEGRPDAHRNGPQMSSHHADGPMVVPDCDGGRLLAPLVARIAYGDITEAELGALEVWGIHAHAEADDPAAVLAGALAVRLARRERERAGSMDQELTVMVAAELRELYGGGAR